MDPSRLPEILDLLGSHPDDPVLLLNAGKLLHKASRPGEALGHLLKLSALHPLNMAVYRELGAALRALGRNDEAKEAYRHGHEASLASRDPAAATEYERLLTELP